MKIVIGADVGNYATKSQETTTPSSFKKNNRLNVMDEESIFYAGSYYSPTLERNNQMTDKTENDYCLIITLFAIAKEIIFQLRRKYDGISSDNLQEKISEITSISLGAGLPVGYVASFAKKTTEFYKEKMGNGIKFTYRANNHDYHFSFKMDKCSIFAQDYTAVAFNDSLEIPKNFEDYYIVGIGGGTVDIIPVSKGRPKVEGCVTLSKGTTVLYTAIISVIQQETGITMDYLTVEAVLLGKNTIIDETRKNRISEVATEYTNKLVDQIIHNGVNLSDKPVVFIGGGAAMMEKNLRSNKKIVKAEFVTDTNSNAKYFAEFVG